MPSFFAVTLDTTAPALAVEVMAGPEDGLIYLRLSADADAIEAKVWGSIDPTDPITNGNYAETQGEAAWFEYEEELLVRVSPGEGQKTFSVQVRDDVWNESAVVTAQIGVVEEAKVPPAPSSFPGTLPRETRTFRRTIEPATRIGVGSRTEVELGDTRLFERRSETKVDSATTVERIARYEVRQEVGVHSRTQVEVGFVAEGLVGVTSDFEIIRRRGHADDEAILALLL